jgi:hypothetical protein
MFETFTSVSGFMAIASSLWTKKVVREPPAVSFLELSDKFSRLGFFEILHMWVNSEAGLSWSERVHLLAAPRMKIILLMFIAWLKSTA